MKDEEKQRLQAKIDALQAELDVIKESEPEIDWSQMAGRLVMVRDSDSRDWEGPFAYGRPVDNPDYPHMLETTSQSVGLELQFKYATPYTGPTRPNWIEWRGEGDCPVDRHLLVLVQMRSLSFWVDRASNFRWSHKQGLGAVMRYTIIEP